MRGLATLVLCAVAATAQEGKGLTDDDPAARAAAANGIGKPGPAAAPLVPQLVDAAYDEDPAVAKAAIQALGRIGPAAQAARPYLRDLLRSWRGLDRATLRALLAIGGPDDEPALIARLRARDALPADARTLQDLVESREWGKAREEVLLALREADPLPVIEAAHVLGMRGGGDADASRALALLVLDPRATVRTSAAYALRSVGGEGAAAFVPMLGDKSVRRRRIAALCIRGPAALKHLRAALRDEDRGVRRNALSSIADFHNRAEPALPDVLALLDDPDLVPETLLVLLRLGPAAAPAMPAIARQLDSRDPVARTWACSTLAGLGAHAAPAAPALGLACFDDDTRVVPAALSALQRLGPNAKDAAPFLAELAEADLFRAGQARGALQAIGAGTPLPPLPDPAELPALRPRLSDPDGRVAGQAAFAIGRLAPKDAGTLEALAAALGHDKPYARRHALLALLRIGDAAMPVVMRVAKDGDGAARRLAASGLVRFGAPPPEGVLPVVLLLLRADDPGVRLHAAAAAGVLGPAARDALPGLVALLESEDAQVLAAAVWAIGQLKTSASGAVPALVALLERSEEQVMAQAVFAALGEIGPGAEPAVPALLAAAREWGDIFPAVNAFVKIGPAGHAAILEIIRTEQGFACEFAIQQVATYAPGTPGLRETLDEVVKHADERVRNAAITAMRQIGPGVQPTPEALIAALRAEDKERFMQSYLPRQLVQVVSVAALLDLAGDEDVRVRWGAWCTLSLKDGKEFTEADRARALPLLLGALESKDHVQVRISAGYTLRSVPLPGPDPRALRLLAEEKERLIRESVSTALQALGAESVPALAEALSDPDGALRTGAALALGGLGPDARPAVPALLDAALAEPARAPTYVGAIIATKDLEAIAGIFLDPRMPERRACGDALVAAKLDALPFLDRARRHGDPVIRLDAVVLLQRLGDAGIPWVLEAVGDPAPNVAKTAVGCLGQMKVPSEQAVPVLARAAREGDPELRSAALAALQRHGAAALPVLKEIAGSTDPRLRAQAIQILAGLGAVALDPLVAALADGAAAVRVAAAQALGKLKEAAAPAAPPLATLLRDADAKVREAAASALGVVGPAALPVLVEASKDGSADCRAAAASALRGHGASAVPQLCTLLKDPDPKVRKLAVSSLGAIGPPAVEALTAILGDRDPAMRASAAQALGAAGAAAAPAVPVLLRLLEDPEAPVRAAAAKAFARLGGAADSALPALRTLLRDPDPAVRQAAAEAVGAFGRAAEPATPDLVELFRKGDDADQAAAASALRAIGATTALLELATDPAPRVRRRAVSMLRSVLGAQALEPLVAALGDADAKVREEAANGLGQLRGAALPALAVLRKALRDPEAAVRQAVLSALSGLGADAAAAVPELTELFRSGAPNERQNAGNVLRSLGPAGLTALAAFIAHADAALRDLAQNQLAASGAQAVPVVAPVMKTKDARREAATVLARIGMPAVRDLADLLRDEDAGVRRDAAWALGTIGPNACDAVSPLVAALDDKDPQVAPQAAWALGQIGPAAKDALPALTRMYDGKRHRVIVADAIRRIRGE